MNPVKTSQYETNELVAFKFNTIKKRQILLQIN